MFANLPAVNRIVLHASCILLCTVLSLGNVVLAQKSPPPRDGAAPLDTRVAQTYPESAPFGRLPYQVRPLHYALDLTVDPREDRFGGTVTITIVMDLRTDHIWLHGNGLSVAEVKITPTGTDDTVVGSWEQELPSGVARVAFGGEWLGPGTFEVVIRYDAPFDRNLAGLFAVEEQGEYYALAKSESIQARRFLPGFDEPGFKAPFDVTLTVPAGYAAIGNGEEVSREPASAAGMERVTFSTTRPLSTYLLSLAVGPFDVVERPPLAPNDVRAHPIPLRGIARKGRGDALKYVLDITPEFVRIFEESLRQPYPYAKLDIVAAPEWPSGATELAAAISYREERILVDGTPAPQVRRALISVHAHELAHMWFGNVVTPPWWDDLWLKEGFATWATPFVLTQWEPDAGHDLTARARTVSAMERDSLDTVRRVREPISANADIRNAYTSIPYVKGAALIAMADAYFGAERFRPALGRYIAQFEDGAADSDQFFASIGEATAEPALTESFRSFVEQAGVPLVQATLMCKEGTSPQVKLQQQRYRPLGSPIDAARQWVIPVCVGYPSQSGDQAARGRDCMLLRDARAVLPLSTAQCPAWVLPNVDGAGYYRYSLSDEGWEALIGAMESLQPTEALTLVDSAMAAFEAGTLPVSRLFDVVEAAARSESRLVITAPLPRLKRYASLILDEAARERLMAWAGDLYRPRLAALAWARTEEERLLRTALADFLAVTAGDPALRRQFAADAAAFVGLGDGDPVADALDADRYDAALAVAVQELGIPFVDAMLRHRENFDDPRFAAAAVSALGNATDPALRERVKGMLLAGEFGTRETWTAVLELFEVPAYRTETWEWFEDHFEQILTLIPQQWQRRTPTAGARFCSDEGEARVRALFARVGESVPGHERPLAQVGEQIQLCAALRAERGGVMSGALAYLASASLMP